MEEKQILSYVKNEPQKIENLREFILKTVHPLKGIKYVLLYKHHEIQIGLLEHDRIEIEREDELTPEYVKELRVFSENGELYIWKQKQELKYRLRVDDVSSGDIVNIYEEEHFMWGNKLKPGNTVYELNRGMELKLPFSLSQDQLPLKYKVYNYYDYDENGIIQFYDARLVNFLDREGKPLA